MSEVVNIDSKIVEVSVVKPQKKQELTKRPDVLEAKVYKLKSPLAPAALYITISDIVVNKGTPEEKRRPFEIFINSKEVSNAQWVVTLTRLISAIFRRDEDCTFILEELKSVYDPTGGYLSKDGYVPSLVAEIGMVIESHFESIGLIQSTSNELLAQKKEEFIANGGQLDTASVCPKCHSKSYVNLGGCMTCLNCGHSICN